MGIREAGPVPRSPANGWFIVDMVNTDAVNEAAVRLEPPTQGQRTEEQSMSWKPEATGKAARQLATRGRELRLLAKLCMEPERLV